MPQGTGSAADLPSRPQRGKGKEIDTRLFVFEQYNIAIGQKKVRQNSGRYITL
jgi:hypothetical protein